MAIKTPRPLLRHRLAEVNSALRAGGLSARQRRELNVEREALKARLQLRLGS
jgi:hypothetical protein